MFDQIHQKRNLLVQKKVNKYGGDNPSRISNNGNHGGKGIIMSLAQGQEGQRKRNAGNLGGNKEIFGNHLHGEEWIQEQKKRNEKNVLSLNNHDKFNPAETKEDKIVFIEPSKQEDKLKDLVKTGQQFVDDDFPPNEKSMCGPYGMDGWEQLQWKKATTLFPTAKIFQGKIQPNDIQQGFLGDCYFLAGLAALAQRPDRIADLFLISERNNKAYYEVKVLYRGKWRTIDLDDYFPFFYTEPAFSKSNENELWVMILEKAWANIYGSYKQIQAGFPEEPLHDLTGAPIKRMQLTHKSKKTDSEWEYLLEASEKDFAMVASSHPGQDSNTSALGIAQGHAYTFLNATQVTVDGQVKRVVQLRNPWGKGEYTGKWSDKDPVWNKISEKEKQRLNYTGNKEDGIFFMEYDDFTNEFKNLSIAQIDDDASYVYQSHWDPNTKGAFFTVTINQTGKYSFQVDQTPERSFTGQKQMRYKYPEVWMEVGHMIDKKRMKKFQAYISKRRTVSQWYDLEPGTYVTFVRIKFDPNFEEDFEITLAVYSEIACGIRISTEQEAKVFNPTCDWSGKKAVLPEKPSQHGSKSQNTMSTKQSPNPAGQANFLQFLASRDKGGVQLPGLESVAQEVQKAMTPAVTISQRKDQPKKSQKQEMKSKLESHKGSNIGASSIPSSASTATKKRVRKVEKTITKTEVYEKNQNGVGFKKTDVNEVKRTTIKYQREDGENVKTKELNKKTETVESMLDGESTGIKQKTIETLKISEAKPDGRVRQTVETRQQQSQTVFEDDEGSLINSMIENNPENKSIMGQDHNMSKKESNSIMGKKQQASYVNSNANSQSNQNKGNQIVKAMMKMMAPKNDKIRIIESDSDDSD